MAPLMTGGAVIATIIIQAFEVACSGSRRAGKRVEWQDGIDNEWDFGRAAYGAWQ